jgi:hypothetical protein
VSKRLALLVAVALSVLLASTAAAAQVRSQGGKVTLLVRRVTQGKVELLNAVGVPRSGQCSLTVRCSNGFRQSLGHGQALGNQVSWIWMVPTTVGVGTARARVACGGADVGTGTFVVRRLLRTGVAVLKRGFTQLPDGRNGTAVSWGVVLTNRSHKEMRVWVDVNFVDAAGNVHLQDGFHVTAIAPGVTEYLADQEYTAGFPDLGKVATVVTDGHRTANAIVALPATDVQISADNEGSAVVDGTVTNDETVQLSQEGACAVFFNSADDVIGGACTPLPSALLPGAQEAFKIDTGPGGPPASSVARVKISVGNFNS